ncbi:AsmA family protein [Wenzhouxiangella sediminis]|uniref:AsmA family protein n=2 Tax=Wenzhouxiangella sediminis TaxID=1792836 RepID=A0A3E1K8T4_9GAMM|nr:AsmA family protein [Wenzhouxiangella sediminis]
MRRTIILAAALGIIVLGLWGTAVIYFDESRLKGIISDRLSEQVGRRVEIVGALEFSLFPRPRLEAREVVIGASGNEDGRAVFRAARVSMSLRLIALLRGDLAPGRIQLEGAVVDLSGSGAKDASSNPLAAIRSSARTLGGRSLSLQDVTFLLPGSEPQSPRRLSVDHIELERFSLDQAVAFRFLGDVGAPPVLEGVRLNGMLYVPSSDERPVRLREMEFGANLAGSETAVAMTGDLAASGETPFRLSLAGGRIRIGESQFDASFNYHGGDRPAADLLLSGGELDWLAFSGFLSERLNVAPVDVLAMISSRVDLRSQLQFDRLGFGEAAVSQARVDLRTQSAGLGLNIAAVFPGGLIEASGVMTGGASHSLAVDVSLAEFGQLLGWLDLPPILEGSGEAQLSLSWGRENGPAFALDGRFDLWDGSLRIAREDSAARVVPFHSFSGELRHTPGFLELPVYELVGGELAGTGWAAVDLSSRELGGELRRSGEMGAWWTLSGSMSEPRLAPLTPPSGERDAEAVEQDEDSGR